MFNPFVWIRNQVREAFLGGIADALDQIEGNQGASDAIQRLASRFAAPALPAPAPETNGQTNGHAEEEIVDSDPRLARLKELITKGDMSQMEMAEELKVSVSTLKRLKKRLETEAAVA